MFILNPYRYSSATPLLLDTYSGAAAAYSLRKLSNSYSGSAIRVRRPNDNAEQDIGFDVNGNLDESSLTYFAGENLLLYSEAFGSVWTKNNTIVTGNATIDPFGNNNANKVSATTLNSGHQEKQNVSVNINTTYTCSCYFKKAEYNWTYIYFNGTGLGGYSYFDLNNGVLGTIGNAGTGGTTSAQIQNIGNGWYRCSITQTSANSVGTIGIELAVGNQDNFGAYVGNNSDGVYFFGAQLNTGSLKTYVQTTSSTRDGNGFVTKWYDQSGNGRDVVQAIGTSQPRLVNVGIIDKYINKPTLIFDGVNDFLNISITAISQPLTFFTLSFFASSVTTTPMYVYDSYGATNRMLLTSSADGVNMFWFAYAGNGINGSAATGGRYLFTTIYNTTSSSTYKNAVLDASGNFGSNNFTGLTVGSRYGGSTNTLNGNIQEIVIYNSNQSSNRTGIETNINSYYSIY